MPRICTICPHKGREDIEDAVLRGESIRSIARKHPGASEDAIRRHVKNHLSAALQRSIEDERIEVTVDRLIAWTNQLQRKTMVLLGKAERSGDLGNARGLIREARENIMLLGRIAGLLEPNPNVSIELRQQVAVLANLSEDELRAIARGAADAEIASGDVPQVFPALPRPHGEGDRELSPATQMGGQ